VVPIVLVVVLVVVIEKAEYARKIRWGVEDEDEYKDEYEFPAGCGSFDFGFVIWDFGLKRCDRPNSSCDRWID
jgi:hypothetical protein